MFLLLITIVQIPKFVNEDIIKNYENFMIFVVKNKCFDYAFNCYNDIIPTSILRLYDHIAVHARLDAYYYYVEVPM